MSNEIIVGQGSAAIAYFCPKCNSPSLEKTGQILIEDGRVPVRCLACGWNGDRHQLLASPFKHGFANDEEVLRNMLNDLRQMLSKEGALIYARFLQKWGFLDEPITAKQLAQYLETIAGAIFTSVVELRQRTVEEAARAGL